MDQEQNVAAGVPAGSGASKNSATMLIIGAVVILVIAAWLMLMRGEPQPLLDESQTPDTMMGNGASESSGAVPAQGNSDEIADIEADLNAADLNGLNEVDQI